MQAQSGQTEVDELRERVKVLEEQLSKLLAAQNSSTSIARSPTPAADAPATVPMGATRIVMHQIVAPAEVDALGICFGGQVRQQQCVNSIRRRSRGAILTRFCACAQVLSWIDIAAGLAAKTLAHGPCVTVSVDAVHFFRCALFQLACTCPHDECSVPDSQTNGPPDESRQSSCQLTGLKRQQLPSVPCPPFHTHIRPLPPPRVGHPPPKYTQALQAG
jgi:hypothetical protein